MCSRWELHGDVPRANSQLLSVKGPRRARTRTAVSAVSTLILTRPQPPLDPFEPQWTLDIAPTMDEIRRWHTTPLATACGTQKRLQRCLSQSSRMVRP